MSEALTKRQADVLGFIREHIAGRGYPPTYREIGLHFGIHSPNGVMCNLLALERKGFIRREPHSARAIVLTESKSGLLDAIDAVLSGIHPGNPLESELLKRLAAAREGVK